MNPVISKKYGEEALLYDLTDWSAEDQGLYKSVSTKVSTSPDKPQRIELRFSYVPLETYRGHSNDPKNKGLSMNGEWEIVQKLGDPKLEFTGGVILLQTTSLSGAPPGRDAAVVIGADGSIVNICTPEQYNYDKNYAPTLREAERRLGQGRLPDRAIAPMDQLTASFQAAGVNTGEAKRPMNYALADDVAKILGMSTESLFKLKIDMASTMESAMNRTL